MIKFKVFKKEQMWQERQPSGLEPLLSQRTRVQLLVPIWWLTINPKFQLQGILWSPGTRHTYGHIHTYRKSIHACKISNFKNKFKRREIGDLSTKFFLIARGNFPAKNSGRHHLNLGQKRTLSVMRPDRFKPCTAGYQAPRAQHRLCKSLRCIARSESWPTQPP